MRKKVRFYNHTNFILKSISYRIALLLSLITVVPFMMIYTLVFDFKHVEEFLSNIKENLIDEMIGKHIRG